jgi:hypothetical protein
MSKILDHCVNICAGLADVFGDIKTGSPRGKLGKQSDRNIETGQTDQAQKPINWQSIE